MTITYTDRGTAVSESSSTTLAVKVSSNCTAGAVVLLSISYDNAGTNGADPFSSITDTHGNTWTTRIAALNDPGAANEGLCVRLFETSQDVTALQTTDTVTITFSTSTTAKVCTFAEATSNIGTVVYSASGSTAGTGASPTITSDSLATGTLIVGMTGQEGGGTQTGDSDTTNGNWSTQQWVVTALAGVANQGITTQGKVVTGAGTQTYNTTINTSRDFIIAWASYTEVARSFAVASGPSIPMPIMCM